MPSQSLLLISVFRGDFLWFFHNLFSFVDFTHSLRVFFHANSQNDPDNWDEDNYEFSVA